MFAAPTLLPVDPAVHKYRMKDLVEASGLDRQTIHFYVKEGLLPPGHKTGRNMALYTDEHLERLETIQRLQRERFLPLKAIKALLDGQEDRFTPTQRSFLVGLGGWLDESLSPRSAPARAIPLDELIERTGAPREDVEEAKARGLLASRLDEDGVERVCEDDAFLFESIAQLRQVGLTTALGFTVEDIAVYDNAVDALFAEELKMLAARVAHLPPEEVATMVERGLPIVHGLLLRLHSAKIRAFFAAMG